MKNIKPLLSILLILTLCSFAAADWVDLKSAAGRFTMKFPRQPVPQSQNIDNGGFHTKLQMFVYDATKYKDDNMAYVIMYCDYPKTTINSDFKDEIVDTILKNSIERMAESMEGKMVSLENSNYKEFPGKNAKLNIKNGEEYTYIKMYLIQSRLYVMEVICEPQNDHNASINKFFDSFTMIDSKPATAKKPVAK